MLEVVDVSADVHVHLVTAQDGVHALLHVQAFDVVLRRLGVDGMVAYDDDPVFLGGCQHAVQPLQLGVDVLQAGVGILVALLAVFVDERGGVQPHDAHGSALFIEGLGVIAGGHLPAAADAGIVEHGLRGAAVLVVAADGVPVDHQFGMAVDQLVVGHPQGIVHGADALEVVHVAGGDDALGTHFLGHLAHQLGDGLLVVVSVAAQVVGHVEVQLVFVDRVVYLVLGNSPLAQQGHGQQ